MATAVAWICLLGWLLVGVAIWSYPGDHRHHDVAVRLREHGVLAPVESVDLDPPSGPLTYTFDAHGRTVTTELDDAEGITGENARNLQVRYLPGDPTQVMLERDIDYYADDALPGGLDVALVGLAPSVLTLAVWLVLGRRPWWRLVPEHLMPDLGELLIP